MQVTREEILRVFSTSSTKGTAVALRISGRKSLLITTIREIRGTSHTDTVVSVHPQTIYGEFIPASQIGLAHIEQAFCLRISYNDPFYLYLRSLRNNIRQIRQEAGLENTASTIF